MILPILQNKYVRYLLLGLLTCAGITLGYLRWTYILTWDHGFKFTYRLKKAYPDSFDSLWTSFLTDPRWLSFLFYSLSAFLLSIASIGVAFMRKDYLINTLMVYLIAWSMVLLLSITSVIAGKYETGIGLAQNLKHLLQTPFFTLLLFAVFKVSEKLDAQKKTGTN